MYMSPSRRPSVKKEKEGSDREMALESSLDNVDEQVSVGSETAMLVEATKSRSNSVKCGPGGPTGMVARWL